MRKGVNTRINYLVYINILDLIHVANIMPPKKSTFKSVASNYLIIVESPSKCRKIEEYLGSQYTCIASNGHIREIPDGLKSIQVKDGNYSASFTTVAKQKKHVVEMQKIICQYPPTAVYLATDDDREGEAIAWHICDMFGLSITTTHRILFHEITKPALENAVQHPQKINMNLVHAQQTRQILDILIGYKITPFLWREFYTKKTASLSAGRCQTPALRLVYDNFKEGETKTPETHYKTTGLFTSRNIPFDLQHTFSEAEQVLLFLEKTKTTNHKIEAKPAKDSQHSPPKPFNTSSLLQTASNQLHYSPKETMRLCQELYQHGHITYMRTECSHYSRLFLDKAANYITARWSDAAFVGVLDKIENKNTALPHEAIRVTQCDIDSLELENKKAATLYRLIWRNTIESCMSDYRFQTVDVLITGAMDYKWKHTIEVPLFLGWKKVTTANIGTEDQNCSAALIHYVNNLAGAEVSYSSINSTLTLQNKHQHFTEANLIHTLEKIGIGRPSTYASLIDTIKDRDYVKCADIEGVSIKCTDFCLQGGTIQKTLIDKVLGGEKKKLVIQPLGILIIEFLLTQFKGLFEYNYTSAMESQLDDISNGVTGIESLLCNQCVSEIQTYSDQFKVYKREHPVIKAEKGAGQEEKKVVKPIGQFNGEDLYVRVGKYGPYLQYGETSEKCGDLLERSQKTVDTITIEEVTHYLNNKPFKIGKDVLRVLNKNMSVRKGKFGAYVYYKRSDMPTPQFFNIRGFSEGWGKCDVNTLIQWVSEKYGLD